MKVLFKGIICETDTVYFTVKNNVVIYFNNGERAVIATSSPDELNKIYDCFASSSMIDLRSYSYEVKGNTYYFSLSQCQILLSKIAEDVDFGTSYHK